MVLDDRGDVAEAQPGVALDRDLGEESAASTIGEMFCTERRWFGVSMKPPVPGVEASRNVSGETQVALPAVLMTSCSPRPWR